MHKLKLTTPPSHPLYSIVTPYHILAAGAIECYRCAVSQSPSDFRAWYGLGQVHEILRMHHLACEHYAKAAALRPTDARMWCALAGQYRELGRADEAMRAYRRAHDAGDADGEAAFRLGELLKEAGQQAEAAEWFRAFVGGVRKGPTDGAG